MSNKIIATAYLQIDRINLKFEEISIKSGSHQTRIY